MLQDSGLYTSLFYDASSIEAAKSKVASYVGNFDPKVGFLMTIYKMKIPGTSEEQVHAYLKYYRKEKLYLLVVMLTRNLS